MNCITYLNIKVDSVSIHLFFVPTEVQVQHTPLIISTGYDNSSSNSCLRWQAVASAPIDVAAVAVEVALASLLQRVSCCA